MKSVSPTGTTASSGTKRKRGSEPKFYSVRVGHRPGIYHSWNECLDQVRGFKNATCRICHAKEQAPGSRSVDSQVIPKIGGCGAILGW